MGRKEKTLLITIIANVILIALRFFLADLSGSVGLAANAWHSMTDAFVTSVVFIGLMIARYGAEKLRLASKRWSISWRSLLPYSFSTWDWRSCPTH